MAANYSVFGFPFLQVLAHILLEIGFLAANCGRMWHGTFDAHDPISLCACETCIFVGYETNSRTVRERAIYPLVVGDCYAL